MPNSRYVIFCYHESPTKTIRRQFRYAVGENKAFQYFSGRCDARDWALAHPNPNLLIFEVNLEHEFSATLGGRGEAGPAAGFVGFKLGHDYDPYTEAERKSIFAE